MSVAPAGGSHNRSAPWCERRLPELADAARAVDEESATSPLPDESRSAIEELPSVGAVAAMPAALEIRAVPRGSRTVDPSLRTP